METKTALWNHLARLKAEINYTAAVTALARRGSVEAKRKYNALWENAAKGSRAKKLNDLRKQEVLWQEYSQQGGRQRRHRLLAYGYLRGKTYKQMETTCREDNKPSPKLITEHAFFWGVPTKATLEQSIKLWLEAGDVSATQVGSCLEEAAQASKANAELELAKTRLRNSQRTLEQKKHSYEQEGRTYESCQKALERAEAEAATKALQDAENSFLASKGVA